MDGVVGTDQEIRADCGKLVCRSKHQLTNTLPVSTVNPFHILGKRRRVYRDFGMSMRAENLRAFRTDRPVAKRGSFGGTGNNADVLGHTLTLILGKIVSVTMRELADLSNCGFRMPPATERLASVARFACSLPPVESREEGLFAIRKQAADCLLQATGEPDNHLKLTKL